MPKTTPNYLKIIIIFLATIIIFFVAISYLPQNKNINTISDKATGTTIEQNIIEKNLVTFINTGLTIKPQIYKNSPVWGLNDAKLTIFQYSCFACLHSKELQQPLKQILDEYGDDIRLVWKDLPTVASSLPAHLAARCANEQNKFWPYHDKLWQTNDFSADNLKTIAKELGLDTNEFSNCLENNKYTNDIQDDIDEAQDLLIDNTPHLYIGSQEIMGIADYADIKRLIDVELSK